MMHKRNLIEDNKKAENQSFLYFLHEEKKFDVKALDNLCHYIIELDTISLEQLRDIIILKIKYYAISCIILMIMI